MILAQQSVMESLAKRKGLTCELPFPIYYSRHRPGVEQVLYYGFLYTDLILRYLDARSGDAFLPLRCGGCMSIGDKPAVVNNQK